MRTAITLTRTHTGKWALVGTPDDSLIEQKKIFRAFRADRSHPEFSTVVYQESDGHAEVIRLVTHDQKKAHEEQKAKDNAVAKLHREQSEKKTDKPTKPTKQSEAKEPKPTKE